MKNILFLYFFLVNHLVVSQIQPAKSLSDKVPYIDNIDHSIQRMRYKVTDSHFRKNTDLFIPFNAALDAFGSENYKRLSTLILEKNVVELQESILKKEFNYHELVLFYLFRIRLFETNPETSLNAIVSLNPEVLNQAKQLDKKKKKGLLYGIPVLLKDNIGFSPLPTTAGAAIFKENYAKDAFITKRLEKENALILGKTNLSEWAYYFCQGCPVGYSALGGQTYNPYGRKRIETGGSSSGSGVAAAMNYAALTVGTETSGSILSPSSANSVVGLKPTVGYLSRNGIVPISSTLDTPGPMTKNVIDNALLLDAMSGFDKKDKRSKKTESVFKDLKNLNIKELKIGYFESLLKNEIYKKAVEDLSLEGFQMIKIEETPVNLTDFVKILSVDMKVDLATYIKENTMLSEKLKKVEDIMLFNLEDISKRAPYGQQNFENIVNEKETLETFKPKKDTIYYNAKNYFDEAFKKTDIILSVANTHAQLAAAANSPCLTLPYGERAGQPLGITLIGPQWSEKKLLQTAYQIESWGSKRLLIK